MFSPPVLILSLLSFFCLLLQPAQALEDYFGRALAIPTAPQRIISLTPATTEMLYALGAQDKLVGITHDCNYPPAAAQEKKQVGRFGSIQLEPLLKLKPDLIVVTADMKKALQNLRRIAVPVLALETPDLRSIRHNLVLLGSLTGREAAAQGLNQRFLQRLQDLQLPQQQPRVFYLVWHQPLMTATQSSFIGEVLRMSGARNVVQQHQAPFIQYSLESLLKQDPDILVLPRSLYGKVQWHTPPFNRLKAVQNKRIVSLDDDLISRPGPRVLEAVETLNQYFVRPRP